MQYPESRLIDLNFTQILHTAIHKEKLAETISERDVVKFLEIAHMLREQMELSQRTMTLRWRLWLTWLQL